MTRPSGERPASSAEFDHDVAIVGGGPAGCSAGVFAARYGLDAIVFDRGSSSLGQCAHLENYLGFPGGIDVETFRALARDHAEAAGCTLVAEMVDRVRRPGEGGGGDVEDGEGGGGDAENGGDESEGDEGFVVETREGRTVTARRVVAAARYDGEFLRGLDDDDAMFDAYEVDGETREFFSRSYADRDGRTPIEGLYVAAPIETMSEQAIAAAGHGAMVGRRVVADARRDAGFWEGIADPVDWLRRESARDGEGTDRERWRERVEESRPDDHELEPEAFAALREAEVDRRLSAYVSDEERERRAERSHDRLLEHLDTDRIRAYLDRVDAESTPEPESETEPEPDGS